MASAALKQPEETPGNRGFFFVGLACIGLLVVTLFAFGLPGIFLLDDLGNLESLVLPGSAQVDLWQASFSNPSGLLMRPLSNLSLALNLSTTGFDVAALKASNIALHLITTVLVALLARRLLPHLAPSLTDSQCTAATLLASAIWALHPLQVSTVLYVVQRMAILSALFSVLAIASLVVRAPSNGPPFRQAAVFFSATILALASKENGALTPLLALAVALAAPSAIPSRAQRISCIALPLVVGGVAILVLWEYLVGGFAGREFTLTDRLATQPFVVFGYLLDILAPLPSRLALFRDDTLIQNPSAPLPQFVMAATVGVLLATLWLRRRFPVATFAILWFFACHAMESTFLPLELEFEHRNYLALFGPALAGAVGAVRLAGLPTPWSTRHALLLLPLALLATLTATRSLAWSREETLAAIELASRPESMRANNLAAVVARKQGDTVTPAVLMRRMQVRYPERFFPWAAELDLACDLGGSAAIPWDAIKKTARRSPAADETLGYFNHITLKIRSNNCRGIDPGLWDTQLSDLASQVRMDGAIRSSQYMTVLRASLREQHDVRMARALYVEALGDGESPDLLARVALFEAEYGDSSLARDLIERLRRHWGANHPQSAQLRLLEQRVDLRASAQDPATSSGSTSHH